jgi:hypothetical protein
MANFPLLRRNVSVHPNCLQAFLFSSTQIINAVFNQNTLRSTQAVFARNLRKKDVMV